MQKPIEMEPAPWPVVAERIMQKATELDRILGVVQRHYLRDNRNLALFNVGHAALGHVRMAASTLEGDIAHLAWRVRNLHELDLILRHIMQCEENLMNWLGQMPSDEKEIVESFLTIADEYAREDLESMKERLARLESVCSRIGLPMSRKWNVRHVAKAVNRESEYELFYRFYSKFVHPTSWIVNGLHTRTGSPMYRNILVGLIQLLADRIKGIIRDEFDISSEMVLDGEGCVPWLQNMQE